MAENQGKKNERPAVVLSEMPYERILAATARLREGFKNEPCVAVFHEQAGEGRNRLRILYGASGPELAGALEEIDAHATIALAKIESLLPSLLTLPKADRHTILRKMYAIGSDPSADSVQVQSVEPPEGDDVD